MQAFWFYLVYPLLYLISCLPFWMLYGLSDFFCILLKLSGYRKTVVLNNLRNSFPYKNEKEIKEISNRYFQYLCDLILETLKTMTMSSVQAQKRCVFHNPEWLNKIYAEGKSIIVLMGHYGNWEWAGPAFSLSTKFQLVVIYRPLSNPYFEKMTIGMRTRHGTKITAVNSTLRDMVANRKSITATAFIADQTATPENAYWTEFLNQDTAIFTGPEKLAKKFDYPVVYMNVKRIKRGHYEVFPELLFMHPKEAKENEILDAFTKRLEKEINIDPAIWLWSHRRWKHKRNY